MLNLLNFLFLFLMIGTTALFLLSSVPGTAAEWEGSVQLTSSLSKLDL